jgi:hypothetical protein
VAGKLQCPLENARTRMWQQGDDDAAGCLVTAGGLFPAALHPADCPTGAAPPPPSLELRSEESVWSGRGWKRVAVGSQPPNALLKTSAMLTDAVGQTAFLLVSNSV